MVTSYISQEAEGELKAVKALGIDKAFILRPSLSNPGHVSCSYLIANGNVQRGIFEDPTIVNYKVKELLELRDAEQVGCKDTSIPNYNTSGSSTAVPQSYQKVMVPGYQKRHTGQPIERSDKTPPSQLTQARVTPWHGYALPQKPEKPTCKKLRKLFDKEKSQGEHYFPRELFFNYLETHHAGIVNSPQYKKFTENCLASYKNTNMGIKEERISQFISLVKIFYSYKQNLKENLQLVVLLALVHETNSSKLDFNWIDDCEAFLNRNPIFGSLEEMAVSLYKIINTAVIFDIFFNQRVVRFISENEAEKQLYATIGQHELPIGIIRLSLTSPGCVAVNQLTTNGPESVLIKTEVVSLDRFLMLINEDINYATQLRPLIERGKILFSPRQRLGQISLWRNPQEKYQSTDDNVLKLQLRNLSSRDLEQFQAQILQIMYSQAYDTSTFGLLPIEVMNHIVCYLAPTNLNSRNILRLLVMLAHYASLKNEGEPFEKINPFNYAPIINEQIMQLACKEYDDNCVSNLVAFLNAQPDIIDLDLKDNHITVYGLYYLLENAPNLSTANSKVKCNTEDGF